MGTHDGRYRFVQFHDDDFDKDEEITNRDPDAEVDLIEDVLGEFPNTWEAMLTGLPPGARKRERRWINHEEGPSH